MPRVRKIDALIVAENELDTCAYTSYGNLNNDNRTSLSRLSSDACSGQLVFEAPVLAKKVLLYRTHGADNGNKAVQRAEIFNFNMANYLWGYSQAAKYSEANTTNIRELPPRY